MDINLYEFERFEVKRFSSKCIKLNILGSWGVLKKSGVGGGGGMSDML